MPATRHLEAATAIPEAMTAAVDSKKQSRTRFAYVGGWAAPIVAVVATYAVFWFYKPYPHSPLNQFLAMFARDNTSAWPLQLVWYAAALGMVGLGVSQTHRATPLICALAAANLAWIGLGYFAWLNPHMYWSAVWAVLFVVEAALFVVAGVLRRDVVVRPGRDASAALGATFIAFALVVYPVAGMIGGHALRTLPLFGLSPCATVTFYFGLMLWAEPPVPKYLVVPPLAWALAAAPPNLARGTVGDYFMLAAAAVTAIFIIWRDRTSARRTLIEGLLLSLMIVWSGHEDVLSGIAVVLLTVTLAQTIRPNSVARPASSRRPADAMTAGSPTPPRSSPDTSERRGRNGVPHSVERR